VVYPADPRKGEKLEGGKRKPYSERGVQSRRYRKRFAVRGDSQASSREGEVAGARKTSKKVHELDKISKNPFFASESRQTKNHVEAISHLERQKKAMHKPRDSATIEIHRVNLNPTLKRDKGLEKASSGIIVYSLNEKKGPLLGGPLKGMTIKREENR